jgi:hypothetical protein
MIQVGRITMTISMLSRLMSAPPGYGPDPKYWVAEYKSFEFPAYQHGFKINDGLRFAGSIDGARLLIPKGAVRLPFAQDSQFIELRETSED